MNVEQWPLARLVPYKGNARLHDEDQIAKIAASITEFGFNNPILVDAKGAIVAGHGRLLAATRLGLTDVPVIVLGHLTPTQARAFRLADNRLMELGGGWDDDLLRAELGDLSAEGYDLTLTGFSADDLRVEPEGETHEERELTKAEQARMDKAWRVLTDEWAEFLDGGTHHSGAYISTTYTRGALAVYFLRALYYGDDIPRNATTPFTGHRFGIVADKGSTIDALIEARTKSNVLASIKWACHGLPRFDQFIGGVASLPIHGNRAPADFPAALARDLIDEFCPAGGAVLDPCHGWGGRLLGFMLSSASKYRGFDVDEETQGGVGEMFAFLRPYLPKKKFVDLALQPFEDVKSLIPSTYDFALTSPPYFNVEKYAGKDQSWRRYATFEKWAEGFYRPLISIACEALKPGATFALQIGNQTYPLEETAIAIAGDLGMKHAETRSTGMTNNLAGTDESAGEVTLILRKSKRR